jgi:mannosyl-3-phosphoglycerate phosphatase
VNYAVVIKGHHDHEMPLHRDDITRVFRADEFGPQGWSQGLNHFIPLP